MFSKNYSTQLFYEINEPFIKMKLLILWPVFKDFIYSIGTNGIGAKGL